MTAASSVVKITAKTALKNNWLKAVIASVAVLFGFLACYTLLGVIGFMTGEIIGSVIMLVLSVFLILPLFLGLIRFFWRLIFGADDTPMIIFHYYSGSEEYKRALHMTAALVFRALLFGIILFIPSFIVDIFSGARVYDFMNIPIPLWTSNLFYFSAFLKTLASIALILVMLRYYLAPFLIIADEKMDVSEAIHMSALIARNTAIDFLSLVFTFLGWILLSVLVFPLVFTMPYFMTAASVHVRFAIAEYNKKAENSNMYNAPSYAEGI